MQIRTVAVLGASGFLGRYVVRRLGRRGIVVAAASRDPDHAGFLRPMGDVGQIAPIAADVTSEADIRAALTGVDAAVNLVGILHESGGQTFEAVHAEAPARIGRLAQELGVRRVVHVSALGVEPGSSSLYARTKAEGERRLREAFPGAVILRPSILFGPEDDFFNRFAGLARFAPALPLVGGGAMRFQPVYVDDVAEAAVKGLDEPGAAGRTYELGGPRVYAFKELMAFLLDEIGRRRRLVPVSWRLALLLGRFLEVLPNPMLTRDQVELLRQDNVVAAGAPGFAELGVTPASVEAVVPAYLERFRKGGWYAARRMERSGIGPIRP